MKIAVVIVALLAGCCSTQTDTHIPQRKAQEFRLDIPKNIWEPLFFKTINERAKLSNFKSLREGALPDGDLEARIWHGFGLTALEGFVLKRSAGQWSAIHLQGETPAMAATELQRQLPTPKSGWDVCWQRLEETGLLALPDAFAIGCTAFINDGMSYVVEFNQAGLYRTYLYYNPEYAKCKEAKQMIQIGNIVAEEFGLPEMGTK